MFCPSPGPCASPGASPCPCARCDPGDTMGRNNDDEEEGGSVGVDTPT